MKQTPSTLNAPMAGGFSPSLGSASLVPPPGRSRRSVCEVIPGWPQAWWKLTCGHYITVPTWATGRTKPAPEKRLYVCHKCEKARWRKWFDRHETAWIAVHGENWSSKPNDQDEKSPR